jgi:endo-1,3-1,4-beta-glycanase ExoK
MKKSFTFLTVLALSALLLSVSCSNAIGTDSLASDESSSRAVQNWSLWDSLDYYNTGVWNKANYWTNGSFFNCGWLADHANFSGGKLVLKLDNVASSGKSYSSGEYRTNNTFSYGTFETNMKAAKGTGTVTAFFLYTGDPWDEIDFEILGKNTWQVQLNYFVNSEGNSEKIIDLGFDASAGYHKYAIEYGYGYINWYIDGKWVWGVNDQGFNNPTWKAMPSHPMQIMVNLWPGTGVDSWLGAFSYSAPLYAYYDYIKYTPK